MLTLRDAGPGDGVALAAHRYASSNASAIDRESYARWLTSAVGRGVYIGRLACVQVGADTAVIAGAGAVLLEWGPSRGDPQPWRARLVNVYTAPDWRRQGLARALCGEVLAQLRGRGIRTVGLAATAESMALYRSLGFHNRDSEMLRIDAAG